MNIPIVPFPGEIYRRIIDETYLVIVKRTGYYSGRLEIISVAGTQIVGDWNVILPQTLIHGLPLEDESAWEKELLAQIREQLKNLKAP